MKKHLKRPLVRVEISCNISSGASTRQGVDVLVPQGLAEGRPLLALVAGGWWHGERESLRASALLLAEAGWPVACLGHRLFDEVPNGLPMCKDLEDGCLKAVEELGLFGHECRSVILIGSGSGSLPALLAAWNLAEHGSLGVAGTALVGAIPQQAWTNCPERWAKMLERFTAQQAELDALARAKDSRPPCLALIAKDDEDLPAHEADAYCERLRQAGCNLERQDYRRHSHDLLSEAVSLETHDTLERLLRWCEERSKPHHGSPIIGEPDFCEKRAKALSAPAPTAAAE
jgi:acetyl esterase/lipase